MDKEQVKKLIIAGMAAKGCPVDDVTVDHYIDVLLELEEHLAPKEDK